MSTQSGTQKLQKKSLEASRKYKNWSKEKRESKYLVPPGQLLFHSLRILFWLAITLKYWICVFLQQFIVIQAITMVKMVAVFVMAVKLH